MFNARECFSLKRVRIQFLQHFAVTYVLKMSGLYNIDTYTILLLLLLFFG